MNLKPLSPALFLLIALASACSSEPTEPRREILADMVDAVPYESFAASPVTPNGQAMMRPPEGSIPRGFTPFHYGSSPAEAERAGRELQNPWNPTPEVRARGEAVYKTFCVPCHGKAGQGDGPVIPRFPTPPSLTAPHAISLPDGRIYHIIARGQGAMPSHAAQVLPDDRWKVVAYLRALQGQGAPKGAAQ